MLKKLFFLYRINKIPWLNGPQLKLIQEQRLRKLILHAYKTVTYYRKLFDSSNVRPEDIKSIFDLSKIPITSKSQIQSLQPTEIISNNYNLNKLIKIRTSGSTGRPLTIFLTKEEAGIRGLFRLRMFLENGYRLTDKMLAVVDLRHSKKKYYEIFGIKRENYISTFANYEQQIETYKRFKPEIIYGYPSCIKTLASIVKERNQIRYPKAIYCTAEVLDTQTRNFIKSVFQVDVIDYYSALESCNIAWECRQHQGYHINSDSIILECIKNGTQVSPGEEGEVVLTNLFSYAMPFIRYKIGDTVILSKKDCPCGRGLPLIERINGRIIDYIVLPNGRTISPYLLTRTILEIPGIRKYQIIQKSLTKIIVKIVKDTMTTHEILKTVKQKFKEKLTPGMEIECILVDKILPENSGKYRVVMSNVTKSASYY